MNKILAAAVIALAGLTGLASPATADTGVGCETIKWGFWDYSNPL